MPVRRPKPRHGEREPIPRFHCNEWGVWHWKPDRKLRGQFSGVSLGRDREAAEAEALRLNRNAEAWLREKSASPAQGSPKAGPKRRQGALTVSQLASLWRYGEDGQGSDDWRGNRERTRRQWGFYLRHIEDEFGDEAALSITPARVKQWIDPLKRRAPGTARSYAACARSLFSWAIADGLVALTVNPFNRLRLTGAKRRKRLFTFEDIRHVVAVADGRVAPPPVEPAPGKRRSPAFRPCPSLGTALVIAFACVQRAWDVIGLGTQHLHAQEDGSTRLIFDQSKSQRVGQNYKLSPGVHIDMRLPPLVAARLTAAPPLPVAEALDWQPLCVCERTRRAYDERSIGASFARLMERAVACDPRQWGHLKGLQLRDGRRSGFVHLRKLGLTVEQIVNMSGHTLEEGYAIVEHYMPRTAEEADKAAAMMTGEL